LAGQEFPDFYGTLKVHYHVHVSPQLGLILGQINQVHILLHDYF